MRLRRELLAEEALNLAEQTLAELPDNLIQEVRDHPVLQALQYFLAGRMYQNMEMWADGSFTVESKDGSDQMNAKAIGETQAFGEVMSWLADTFSGENKDADTERL